MVRSLSEHWRGAGFFAGMLIVTLIVQAIEEGTSPWTIFKAAISLAVLVIVLALVRGEGDVSPRASAGSWVILAAIPWAVNIVVEPSLVFSTAPASFGLPPHQAFHLLLSGVYALGTLLLVAFVAARPLRHGQIWSFYVAALVAATIALADVVGFGLLYRDVLHLAGHLIPPALMLLGTGLAWMDARVSIR